MVQDNDKNGNRRDKTGKNEQNGPLIVIASNRGPFSFTQNEDGTFDYRKGAGGLVTALSAVAENNKVQWVATAISKDDHAWVAANPDGAEVDGIDLKMIAPPEDQYDAYYNVIANPLIWFIHHEMWDMPRSPVIDKTTWDAWENGYVAVNQLMADALVEAVKDIAKAGKQQVFIFPQDYHLYMLPGMLRDALGETVQIQPFIHIPWPGPDSWRVLPSQIRNAILVSLLKSDRVGFQTSKDAFNFVQTCRFYLDGAHSYGSRSSIEYDERKVFANAYPISVNVEKIEALASEGETRLLKELIIGIVGDRKLILRVDRMEPSKNILRGFQAYRALLEEHPELHNKITMMALLVPSRMAVDEYQSYLKDVMTEVGFINADFSDEWWEPVRLILGDNYPRAVAAMQLYDVLLVNPIADGMNLVAKEGPLVNTRDGVLILSEDAGAYYELGKQALTVTPTDVYGTSEALYAALKMPPEERAQRSAALRKIVKENDVQMWFQAQLDDATRADSEKDKKSSTPPTPKAK